MTQYLHDQRPATRLDSSSRQSLEELKGLDYAVLVGRNNSGKSFVLRSLAMEMGESAAYIGPARYQNFNLLNHYAPNRNRRQEKRNRFAQWFSNKEQNLDNSVVNLQQAIAEMSDADRQRVVEITKRLLGVELSFPFTVLDNSMSQKYVSCGGHNLSYTSSGVRLILTLLTSLLDPDYNAILIDEPELGISPELQAILSDFMMDSVARQEYFPHLKHVFLGTHSSIFLSRRHVTQNFMVSKSGDVIKVERAIDHAAYNRIHFWLLGNRFETLYLPSVIVLVEGKTDHEFIQRVTSVRYPDSQISVLCAGSDSQIKSVLNTARGLLSDLQRSPYRDRIFAVLDSTHGKGLPTELEKMGLPQQNIVVWSKNGIEYLYPREIVDSIYGLGEPLTMDHDRVSRNGVSYTKAELSSKVAALVTKDTKMNDEFEKLLLLPLEQKLPASK